MSLDVKKTDTGLSFPVKVVPGGSRTRLAGLWGSALKVNIAAPPQKGKANKELLAVLAKLLNKPISHLTILTGQHNPHKEIQITQITEDELLKILEPYLE